MIIWNRITAWVDGVTAKLRGYRTKLFAYGALVGPGVAALVAGNLAGFDWTAFVSPKWMPVWMIVVGVVVHLLRSITTPKPPAV